MQPLTLQALFAYNSIEQIELSIHQKYIINSTIELSHFIANVQNKYIKNSYFVCPLLICKKYYSLYFFPFVGKAVPFVELTVAHASVLTILAISFERYYAICEPLKAGYVCTKTRALMICLLAWAVAAIFTR